MTITLRAADPAADVRPDPNGVAAQAMLRDILATGTPTRATRPRSLRRIVVGGTLVGAAATAVVALPMPWDHHGPGLGSRAYAVERHGDGSVEITLRWSELDDPQGLQAALDAAGARTTILFATERPGSDPGTPPPDCAKPYSGGPYSARAVQWDFPDAASAVNGIVIHPDAFPPGTRRRPDLRTSAIHGLKVS